MKLRETRIVNELIRNCYDEGLHYKVEVPLYRSKIDLVTVNPSNNEVVAIEAKISNWYRALQQATSYTMCANKVYIALWHEYAHRVNHEILDRYGIGLLSVNGIVEEVHRAKNSREVNKDLFHEIRNFVLEEN